MIPSTEIAILTLIAVHIGLTIGAIFHQVSRGKYKILYLIFPEIMLLRMYFVDMRAKLK
jgi:hypothetical protein